MNVITVSVMDELEAIIDAVAGDDAIKGAVITSGKDSFSGGADLSMLQGSFGAFRKQQATDPEGAAKMLFEGASRLQHIYRKLETCGKPFVAAINGVAMGGATEMALACHGRVLSDNPKTKLGLPEVKVGLFPGAGGTQRVPRLIHTQEALQMLLLGKSYDAVKARKLGLVHEVVPAENLVETARKMITDGLSPVQPWDEKGYRIPAGSVYSKAGAQLFPSCKCHLPARDL